LIAMPKTACRRDLPYAGNEIEQLMQILSSDIEVTTRFYPTRADALVLLKEHPIVHMACHGQVCKESPSQSAILLSDWQDVPLTVSDLTELNIEFPQFAYLSACHTSSAEDERLFDESITLCAAVQLAGYPSVVGSLFPINDQHSSEVATGVYNYMREGIQYLNTIRSAEGLHHVVLRLRDKTREVPGFTKKTHTDPLIWAPYVHLGC